MLLPLNPPLDNPQQVRLYLPLVFGFDVLDVFQHPLVRRRFYVHRVYLDYLPLLLLLSQRPAAPANHHNRQIRRLTPDVSVIHRVAYRF